MTEGQGQPTRSSHTCRRALCRASRGRGCCCLVALQAAKGGTLRTCRGGLGARVGSLHVDPSALPTPPPVRPRLLHQARRHPAWAAALTPAPSPPNHPTVRPRLFHQARRHTVRHGCARARREGRHAPRHARAPTAHYSPRYHIFPSHFSHFFAVDEAGNVRVEFVYEPPQQGGAESLELERGTPEEAQARGGPGGSWGCGARDACLPWRTENTASHQSNAHLPYTMPPPLPHATTGRSTSSPSCWA